MFRISDLIYPRPAKEMGTVARRLWKRLGRGRDRWEVS